MLKVNDVLNTEFGANLGGYKKADVDAFCEEVAKTLEVLYKENSDLVRKLQVLAEKVEEYRKDEQNIQSALLIAQRAGEQIVKDSQQQADEKITAASAEAERILSEAQNTADDVLKKTEEKVIALANDSKEKSAQLLKEAAFRAESIVAEANENVRAAKEEYEELKSAVSDFRTGLILMYKEHLKLIGELPSEKKAEVPEPEPTVSSVPEAVEEPAESDVTEPEIADEPEFVDELYEENVVDPIAEYTDETDEDDNTDAFVMSSVSASVSEDNSFESELSESAEPADLADVAEIAAVAEPADDYFPFADAIAASFVSANSEVSEPVAEEQPGGIDKLNEFVEPPKPKNKRKSSMFSEDDEDTVEEVYQTEGQLSIDFTKLKFGDDYSVEEDSDDDFAEEKHRGFWRKK